ncbi:MAG: hypothetical protein QXP77_01090, partial [Candidatus Aenigmatarchaeota archaeon]
VCSPLYCMKVHELVRQAKEVFNEETFIYLGINSYFFGPLEESVRLCGINCEICKANYRIVKNFINSLVKSFS